MVTSLPVTATLTVILISAALTLQETGKQHPYKYPGIYSEVKLQQPAVHPVGRHRRNEGHYEVLSFPVLADVRDETPSGVLLKTRRAQIMPRILEFTADFKKTIETPTIIIMQAGGDLSVPRVQECPLVLGLNSIALNLSGSYKSEIGAFIISDEGGVAVSLGPLHLGSLSQQSPSEMLFAQLIAPVILDYSTHNVTRLHHEPPQKSFLAMLNTTSVVIGLAFVFVTWARWLWDRSKKGE